jgi:GNAT superfamily N-acetyltransferase
MLRRATSRDIDAIMEIERQPGFEDLVGRSARSIHEELVEDPGHAYLLGLETSGTVRGVAILRGIGDPMGGVYLKRIAIRDPGQGFGSAMLAAVIDWAFSLGDCHRFHLDHFVTNVRAHRAYAKCGLRQEGILKEAYRLPDGRFADLAVMAITRAEWAELRKRAEWQATWDALSPLQRKLREKGLTEVVKARHDLFAPLGREVSVTADPGFLFTLWRSLEPLHPEARHAEETARLDPNGNSIGETIRSVGQDLASDTRVDLLFRREVAAPAFVDRHESSAGALCCSLGEAIDLIDRLERSDSPLLRDEVAIAARDRTWAIWWTGHEIVRTSWPGRG